jgi:hypothetical protein
MDPTAADVRAGTAIYNADTGAYEWLPGYAPAQVWDSGTGSAVVTVTSPPKAADHSLVWLVLAAGLATWLMDS